MGTSEDELRLEANAEVLKEFFAANAQQAIGFNWLQGRSVSEAFVICIGAGPWKFNRRKTIQGQALEKLRGRDIMGITEKEAYDFYPLDWQNHFLIRATNKLKEWNVSFFKYCAEATENPDFALSFMRNLVQTKDAKVISLFCRDRLWAPSFPIDRHVRRKLQELKLPTKEDDMIQVCNRAGIDPRKAAVVFVRTASDMDNPDWSINDY